MIPRTRRAVCVLALAVGVSVGAAQRHAAAQIELPAFPSERRATVGIPHAVTAGDLDADGRLDAVVGYATPGRLEVFRGDGFGHLESVDVNAPGQFVDDLFLVDMNLDGHLDAVFFTEGPSQIRVFRGDGTCDLVPSATINVASLSGIAVGDVSGDGRPDVVASSWATPNVRVYVANANGTFQTPTLVPVPGTQSSVALSDANGDAELDILALISGSQTQQKGAYLVPGLGGGSFGSASWIGPTASLGANPSRIGAADIDRNGIVDVVYDVDLSIRVLLGTGGGSFQAPIVVAGTGGAASRFRVEDFDGDGWDDLLTCRQSGLSFGFAAGSGTGSFAPSKSLPASGPQNDFDVADMNGDLVQDLVVADYENRIVGISLGDGAGGFVHPTSDPIATLTSTAVTDTNGDGAVDVLVADGSMQLHTYLGDGAGSFVPSFVAAMNTSTFFLLHGDVDSDGQIDVLNVASGGGVPLEILHGQGTGAFSSSGLAPITGVPTIGAMDLGDADADGDLDLYVSEPSSKRIMLLTNDGTASFTATGAVPFVVGPFAWTPQVIARDTDADGDDDALSLNGPSNSYSVVTSNGTGSIAMTQTVPTGVRMQSGSFDDVDQDGLDDLVVTNNLLQLAVFRGQPGSTFAAPIVSAIDGQTRVLRPMTDVNGDGFLDALGIRSGLSIAHLELMLGDAALTFATDRLFCLHAKPSIGVVTDLEGDGASEILVVGPTPFGSGAYGITLYDDACFGAVGTHGYGCSNGVDGVPRLAVTGCPRAGAAAVLRIDAATSHSVAILGFGLVPANQPVGGGCSLLIAPLFPSTIAVGLTGGKLERPLHVPSIASDLTVEMQAFLPDASAAAGFVTTNALTIVVD